MVRQDLQQHISVFVARYPFEVLTPNLPDVRQKEIENISNSDVAKSKYYAFKLLEIALKDVYNVGINDCNLVKTPCGKWQCDVCNLSVSHSCDVVAVAVSDLPVGIDVEKIDVLRFNESLQKRIFTAEEQKTVATMQQEERRLYANRLWTVKEAIFKLDGQGTFVSSNVDSGKSPYITKTVSANCDYYLTVATSTKNFDVDYCAINVTLQ